MKTFLSRLKQARLLRTVSGLSVLQALNILTGLAMSVLLARVLGVGGYGVYIFSLTLVQLASLPVELGVPTLLMRQVAYYNSSGDRAALAGIIRWSLGLVLFAIMGVALVAGAIFLFWQGRAERGLEGGLLALSVGLVAALGLARTGSAILAGFNRVFFATLADSLIRPVLLLALVFGLQFWLTLSPLMVMALHVVAALVALIWVTQFVWQHCVKTGACKASGERPYYNSRGWIRSLLPLTIVSGIGILNAKLDIAMLGILVGTDGVGVYIVGVQVAGMLMLAQSIINSMLAPRFAALHATQDLNEMQNIARRGAQSGFLVGLIGFILILLIGDRLIEAVFGHEFTQAYNVALIIGAGNLFNVSLGAVTLLLNMTGSEKVTANIVLVSIVVNASLNLLLIPLYGAYGAAIATAGTMSLSQILMWRAVRKHLGIRCDVF
jgi:O-antigen/teichoic acid export membrane protein